MRQGGKGFGVRFRATRGDVGAPVDAARLTHAYGQAGSCRRCCELEAETLVE